MSFLQWHLHSLGSNDYSDFSFVAISFSLSLFFPPACRGEFFNVCNFTATDTVIDIPT